MENFTEEEMKKLCFKLNEAYNKVVPKYLKENKNIDKDKEKSFADSVEKYRCRLKNN